MTQLHWLPRDVYRKSPELGTSQLKAFVADPYGYKMGIERTTTAQMQWGCDFEEYLFTGELPDVAILPEHIKRKDARIKEYAAFVEANPDRRILRHDEFEPWRDSLQAACRQVHDHAEAYSLVTYALDEWPSIFWQCPITGVQRKAELDLIAIHEDKSPRCITDLKTCSDESWHGFASQAERLKYHWQAASYQQGMEAVCGAKLPVLFICVRNSPHYNVEVYEMPQDWIDAGLAEVVAAIEQYQAAESSGVWRSPTWGTVTVLERPRWAKYQQAIEVEDE